MVRVDSVGEFCNRLFDRPGDEAVTNMEEQKKRRGRPKQEPPAGYVTDDTVYTIQISGGQAKILNQAGDVVTKLVNEESDFLLDELPHTGSVSMLVCMVCGGTSLMVGLLLCSGKKKRI